jgi:predicted nucleotidyltransferase
MTSPNLRMLEIVARGLKELRNEVVFVGGASTILYVDSKAAPEPRPTDDVDCVIEVASRAKYAHLEEKLRALGFTHDRSPQAPACRWNYEHVVVDVMPTNEKILGFSNRWYEEGITRKESRTLKDGTEISVFSLPYLLASKIEAYKSRGKGEPRTSPDIEDIVFVLDGNVDPLQHVAAGSSEVRNYLNKEFGILLSSPGFLEAIEGTLQGEGSARIDRVQKLIGQMTRG